MTAFQIEFRRDTRSGTETGGETALHGWQIRRQGDWDLTVGDSGRGTLSTPGWPEPASLRVEWNSDAILVIPDHASVATVFYRTDHTNCRGTDLAVVSTDFGQLLRLGTNHIRPEAIEECTLLGHLLGSGTIVEEIKRVRQGQALRLAPDGLISVVSDNRSCPLLLGEDRSAILALRDSPHFDGMTSAAIELTGGLDSRLSLAILLAAGRTPGHACTFGTAESADVQVAQDLAGPLGIEHHLLRLDCDASDTLDLTCDHLLRTGGLLSFTKYAPLMKDLRRASSFRDSQVSGLGGELGIDFYQVSGLDSMVRRGRFDTLVRHRILQVPPSLARLRNRSVSEVTSRVAGKVSGILSGYSVGGEDALRWFYSRERMNNWAFVGLNANRYEFGLRLPLLSREYLQWCNALPAAKRHDRVGQFDLLRVLASRIENGQSLLNARVSGSRGWRRIVNHARKLLLRIVTGADPRRDADTASVLRLAADDERLRTQLERLSDIKVFGHNFTLANLGEHAASGDMLVGMFVTAAAVLDRAENGPRATGCP